MSFAITVEPDVVLLTLSGELTVQDLRRFAIASDVAGPSPYGMAREFQTLNDDPQITIQIFKDYASALAWFRS